ncbi:MAG TPA: radical SAM protein, partial [Phnomibacter sp.]|nr:radical SAM protein [Phnomibacter sp.]
MVPPTAGIYVHIPFCRKACHYCNFHFSTSLHQKDALMAALHTEISRGILPASPDKLLVDTLYFGGGSPSILTPVELSALLDNLRSGFAMKADAEVTLEANPDDIDKEKLQA